MTPAAGYVPPDDTPAIRVGATIFADYTVQANPKIKDADGNEVTSNAFNVTRTYINITGNISHNIAFRITPDITRETESATAATSIAGNYVFRLKYGFVQFNLDDYLNKGRTGSWVRLGVQQTPWVDYMEGIYRYRFQGTIFSEREGFLSSSDIGASFHYSFAAQLRRGSYRLLQRRDVHEAGGQRSEGLHDSRDVAPVARERPRCAGSGSVASTTTTRTSRTPIGHAVFSG